MKLSTLVLLIVLFGLMSGCVRGKGGQPAASVLSLPQIVLQQEDTYTILACVHETQSLTRIEFRNSFTQAAKQRRPPRRLHS